ncbi:peptide chain release factor N(5)-glutamine methyltransferase [Oerskovia turbata]|uniref:peptide chain release factor N(5)-glutamine methyltransferase n=1 Tax=Oerskovia turbata TaxID=1713 RepID=A0A4Q1KW07_9CELL|nr:peptide chain release factor N(5)-glutamine methyltransferase [Oerskovia turbata]RXR27123.1 peptide chain release factor N(5)-glutamine methyltransferase [Oerskovia turbata]RXR34433.1 peptide chain release factor N(5)-glutamine methyltransferase [Oerskovia turbata]
MPDDVSRLVRDAAARLGRAGIDTPRVDAELLLAHAAGVPRERVVSAAVMGRPVSSLLPTAAAPTAAGAEALPARTVRTVLDELARLLDARAERVPLQHLVGTAPFRHLDLVVGPGVFVPRPETEQVAQVAIDEVLRVVARGSEGPVVVDLCTGSGAIALAVATEVPGARVHAVELDRDAHAWAERNVARTREASGAVVHLVRGDARTALAELDGSCDVIVSNPPYVPPDAVPRDPEVALHDPRVALYGLGEDGLEVPRGVTRAAARLLAPGGLYVMEHAEVQARSARDMVAATGAFEDIRTADDLTGRPRMVVARRARPTSEPAPAPGDPSDMED